LFLALQAKLQQVDLHTAAWTLHTAQVEDVGAFDIGM
jgi:hypothetical protein